MKTCLGCGASKEAAEFGVERRRRDSLRARCRPCRNADASVAHALAVRDPTKLQRIRSARKRTYEKNKPKVLAARTVYRVGRAETDRISRAARYQRNKEQVAKTTKVYRDSHPALYAQAGAKRRASKRKATPPWVDHKQMAKIYSEAARLTHETGTPHEVDHLYPLQNPLSCGLHVPWNLRIVTRRVNRSKINKMPDVAAIQSLRCVWRAVVPGF